MLDVPFFEIFVANKRQSILSEQTLYAGMKAQSLQYQHLGNSLSRLKNTMRKTRWTEMAFESERT